MSDDSPIPSLADANEAFRRGDGTVPGPSAVPIEWTDTAKAIAVNEKHVAMPSASVVTDILHNYANPLDAWAYMGDADMDGTIGLNVPPLVMIGKAFEIVVDVIKTSQLNVTLTPIESTLATHSQRIQVNERSSARLEFTLTKQGSYLITAKSVDLTRPSISDLIIAVTLP
jgi:hypothetical protein